MHAAKKTALVKKPAEAKHDKKPTTVAKISRPSSAEFLEASGAPASLQQRGGARDVERLTQLSEASFGGRWPGSERG